MPFKVSIISKERGIISEFTLPDHEAAHFFGCTKIGKWQQRDEMAIETAVMKIAMRRCELKEGGQTHPPEEIPDPEIVTQTC